MIEDSTRISIRTVVDNTTVSSDTSVSLGLIVTELVINALKHAFTDEKSGEIVVEFASHGPNWSLSVRDNGIGMPIHPETAKSGLGTSIVEALANQLNAEVIVSDARPGTSVSIDHTPIAAVHSEDMATGA